MKKSAMVLVGVLAGLAMAAGARAQSLLLQDRFRQSVQGAILEEARTALAAAPIPSGTPVAIVPIFGDEDGWLAGQLKIALSQAGKNCVEGRDDPMWTNVVDEITWKEHKEPFLDPKTLDRMDAQKFQAAKILLTGAVRSLDYTDRYAYFEIELHATEVATKRHLWGAVCAKRQYVPGVEGVGRVEDLPAELRQAMQDKLREKLEASLSASKAVTEGGRVALLPLAADERGYVGGLVRDSTTKTLPHVVNADWATLSEARIGLRDPGSPADAVLHGSVRDLSYSKVETSPTTMKMELRAEVQLVIEKAYNIEQQVLWSDTITVAETRDEGKGIWASLVRLFPSLQAHPARAVWVPLLVLVALILLGKLLSAMTRVR